jgi:uracil-DNA glycosylase family 4
MLKEIIVNPARKVRVEGTGPVPAEILVLGRDPGVDEVLWAQCTSCGHEFSLSGLLLSKRRTEAEIDNIQAWLCGLIENVNPLQRVYCPRCRTAVTPESSSPTPFVGTSGRFQDGAINKAGMKREAIFFDYLVPYRPPKNDSRHFAEIGVDPADFTERLHDTLARVRPRIIIPTGNEALQALTGLTGITKYRGSPLRLSGSLRALLPNSWVLPTYHPTYIQRLPYKGKNSYGVAATTYIKDWRRMRKFRDNALLSPPKRTLRIRPTKQEALDYMARASASSEPTATDTEWRRQQISCFSIALTPLDSLTIPVWEGWGSYWDLDDEIEIWQAYGRYLESSNPKVLHNAQADLRYFWHHGLGAKNIYLDTMAAWRVLWPELPRSLAYIQSVLTLEPYHKDERKDAQDQKRSDAPGDEDQLWRYCALDSAVTLELAGIIAEQAIKAGLQNQIWPE